MDCPGAESFLEFCLNNSVYTSIYFCLDCVHMIIIVKFLIWHVNSMSEITVFSLKNRFVTSPKIQKIRFLEAKSGIIVMQMNCRCDTLENDIKKKLVRQK